MIIPQELNLINNTTTRKIKQGNYNNNITYAIYNTKISGAKDGFEPGKKKTEKPENPLYKGLNDTKDRGCQISTLGPNEEFEHLGTLFSLYVEPRGLKSSVGNIDLYSGVDKVYGKRFKPSKSHPDGYPLVISIDSEWVQVSEDHNHVLSYQFSTLLVDGGDFIFNDFIFYVFDDNRASLTELLSFIVIEYLYKQYRHLFSYIGSCRTDVGSESLHIVLVFHLASVDIRSFTDYKDYMGRVLDFSKALASESLYSTRVMLKDKHRHGFASKVMIRDTSLLVGDDVKSLKDLGDIMGVNKIDIGDHYIKNMDELRNDDITKYTEYAIKDSFITLLWYNSINHGEIAVLSPLTISSRSSQVVKAGIMVSNNYKSNEEFNAGWRGLETYKTTNTSNGKTTYSSSLKASPAYRLVDGLAIGAYKGGRNESFISGAYPYTTYDYDLSSAYPTAAFFCNDIDWDVEPVIMQGKKVSLGDGFINPHSIIMADISFEYPEGTQHPGIAQKEDAVSGSLLFTRKGRTVAYTPEIIEALEQGCDIYAHTMYIFTIKTPVRNSLFDVLLLLLKERKDLGERYGVGSPIERISKMQVNAAIGKMAQGISGRKSFDLITRESNKMPDSVISHPIYAGLITAYARSMMSASINAITKAGYDVINVTTDGFISNIEPDKINELNYGMIGIQFRQARTYINNMLGDNKEVYEVKHYNPGWVVSSRTRLNFSSNTGMKIDIGGKNKELKGVLARGGIKYPEELNGSTEALKRAWFIELYLNRSGRVVNSYKSLPMAHDMYNGSEAIAKEVVRNINMDYDFKREPLKMYKAAIEFNNKTYLVDSFTTKPFNTVDEYLGYREAAARVESLHTHEHIERVRMVYELNREGIRTYDVNNDKMYLINVLRHYRAGKLVELKNKDGKPLNGKEVICYINSVIGENILSYDNWKKAGQANRSKNTVPLKYLDSVLSKLKIEVA